MSLWTPYAIQTEDTPLDLSGPVMKTEPPRALSRSDSPYEHAPNLPPVSNPVGQPQYFVYAPPPYGMAAAQISPISSTCSSNFMPIKIPYRPRLCTPPESPVMGVESTRPLSLGNTGDADSLSDDPEFQDFERDALRAMAEKNGGELLGNNPRMRRSVSSTSEDAAADSYRRQRERNNVAAKQSRDRRKLREIHLALKVSYLKKQVAKLKMQLAECGMCSQCRRYN